MPTKTMLWENDASMSITVHGAEPPTNQEWEAYLTEIRRLGPLHGRKVIVVSHGGGPNGSQRKRLVDQLGGQTSRTVIFTDNTIMRGIGVAVSWFNRSLKVFGLQNRGEGYGYLELSPDEVEKAEGVIRRLSRALLEPSAGASNV